MNIDLYGYIECGRPSISRWASYIEYIVYDGSFEVSQADQECFDAAKSYVIYPDPGFSFEYLEALVSGVKNCYPEKRIDIRISSTASEELLDKLITLKADGVSYLAEDGEKIFLCPY